MLIKLAWRNIWRNKRRTIITVSSIFFAAILSMLTRSMQEGSYSGMIKNSVRFYSGYVQIHDQGYWEDKSINKLMADTPELKNKVESNVHVNQIIPRLETFALAASENLSKGTMIMGISPEEEDKLTSLKEKIVEGEYLKSDDQNGLVITTGLAQYLKLGLGDTLVLIGQGYHGVNAAGKYPIVGLLEHPNPQMNKGLVFMPIKQAQYYNASPEMVTSYVLGVDDIDSIDEMNQALRASLGDEYEVMSWNELQPELEQAIESDRAGGIIMLMILYMVIGFGIFGTLMMMAVERKREFGVLVALGMHKINLVTLVFMEAIMIGAVAIGVGLLVGYPLVTYLHFNPIPMTGTTAIAMEEMGIDPVLMFSMDQEIFTSQAISVFTIMILCLSYPIYAVLSLKVFESIRA